MGLGFRLGNGEELNASHPRTFFIPSRTQRETVTEGDLVKLLFEPDSERDGLPRGERMWVQVTQAHDCSYVGTLDNSPQYLTAIKLGDHVTFRPEHILAIWEDRPEPDLKVCVSRRSHAKDLRPQYIVREAPLNPADSGWQVLVGDESDEKLRDHSNVLLQPMDFVLARWPELQHVFSDTAATSAWNWDPGTHIYRKAHSGL